jgi:hypothetical protein
MELPTQAEVNAATRHIASFAGGLVVAFGLGTKINPDTLQSIINATGTLVQDGIALAGLLGPIIGAYYASRSAKPAAQAASLAATATGPASPAAVEAQKGIIAATAAVAADPSIPTAQDAKAVIAAVAAKGA